ncbi:Immunoglobulin domain-containing protein [Desulfonema magnum]|uniref:Immunoglobulin domain-containing protein n=1 Tax=Desulfonema magnum TaxID=45655 RepID=A0A975GLG9_9BACT|nr:Immunoglobulin domain-containing protein [Desulfonema magnum]
MLACDSGGNLYAGGYFSTAGGVSAKYIAKWDGSAWTPLGSGMNGCVRALACDSGGNLYAGGYFTTAGGVSAKYIAKWDGIAWSALGDGMDTPVDALACDSDGNLYAGGNFTTAGRVSAKYIAKWDGITWRSLSIGMSFPVCALVCSGGNLYAGGGFTTAGRVSAKYIAKWDGIAWSALGDGMDNFVYALACDSGGNLYAGGNFTTAGGVSAKRIAKWNGSIWSALGSGMSGSVYALACDSGGNLYAGGWFTTAGGVSAKYIAKWNGSTWSALGSGMNNAVRALACDSGGNFYAGGDFTTAGGVSANYIARYVANTAPTADNDSHTTNEDTQLNISAPGILANDSDPDSNPLTAVKVSDPANGSVSLDTDGAFSYTPNGNYHGSDSFTYKANDGTDDSNVATVTVTVTPVDDPPVITGQNPISVAEETALTVIPAHLTITDPDSSVFTLAVSGGASYTVSGTTITPAADFNGTLTVPVTANDGTSDSGTYNLSVTVTAVNDVPQITGQVPLSVAEDSSLTVTPAHLTITDPDSSVFTLAVSGGANYTVSGTTITPAADFNGTLTVPVTANDGTSDSGTYNLSVTVTAVNDVPQITGQVPLSVAEDSSLTVTPAHLSITDPDSSAFTLTISRGASYTVSGTTITPAADFNGTLTVPVTANDGTDDSNTYDLSVTVTAVNDVPQITGQVPLTVSEDSSLTVTPAHLTITDPDSSAFTLTVSGGASYTVSGTTITPVADFNGTLTVPVTVSDGSSDSPAFNVTVAVSPVDDPPTLAAEIADVTADEDAPDNIIVLSDVFTDIDSDVSAIVKTLISNTNSDLVSAEIAGDTLTLTYQPDQHGEAVITVSGESDGKTAEDTFTVTVNPVDDPPVVAAEISDAEVTEGEPATVTDLAGMFMDIDNDDSAIILTVSGDNPSLVVPSLEGNTLTLAYQEDQIGMATVTVTAESGGKTVTEEFAVTVLPRTYAISGNVTYFSNALPVSDVLITLEGTNFYTGDPVTDTALTDKAGTYTFSDVVRGDYTITAFRDDEAVTESLSATDASKIALSVLGKQVLSEMQKKAADVTGNGSVTGLDASRLVRFTTGLIPAMSDNGKAASWQFDTDSSELSPDSDMENLDFVAAITGDVSGNYSPGSSPGALRTSRVSEVSVTVTPGEILSVPVILEQETAMEGIDIRISYDSDMLAPADVILAGGILEYEDYELTVNTDRDGEISLAIFAISDIFTGSGTVVTVNFDVIGPKGSSVLEFVEFRCNEIPVSDRYDESRDTGAVSGGFYLNGALSQCLRIRIDAEGETVTYDLNGDGRTAVEDAIIALRRGDLEGAIRALQCLTEVIH